MHRATTLFVALSLLVVTAAPTAALVPTTPPGCTPATVPTATNSTPVTISSSGASTITSTVLIAGAQGFLFDADVTANITHTFNSDLQVTLTSPMGTIVTLTSDNGGSNNDVYNGVTWDDDADPDGLVPYAANPGLTTDHPYADGVNVPLLAPEEALAAFIGENPNGLWTLTIADRVAGNGGALNSWSLNLTTLSSPPVTTALPVASNTTSQAINSATTPVSSTISIPGGGTVLDVNVTETSRIRSTRTSRST
jgi:subtilisin-like proprotein convertase family protein